MISIRLILKKQFRIVLLSPLTVKQNDVALKPANTLFPKWYKTNVLTKSTSTHFFRLRWYTSKQNSLYLNKTICLAVRALSNSSGYACAGYYIVEQWYVFNILNMMQNDETTIHTYYTFFKRITIVTAKDTNATTLRSTIQRDDHLTEIFQCRYFP